MVHGLKAAMLLRRERKMSFNSYTCFYMKLPYPRFSSNIEPNKFTKNFIFIIGNSKYIS